ncbi:MAG: biopolymer transporter ExbD [Chitinivibrionales bacterium]|nr:biopolymer transporter ExbD [Chitinivibrionales bacterium]
MFQYHLTPPEQQKPEINLAPFVDTIMILLIFFVVTANLYVITGIEVSKPKAQMATSQGQQTLLIGLSREGTIHVYGRQIALERLKALVGSEVAKHPNLSIVIISDQNAIVGRAVQIMDQCALAGGKKVSIAADRQ